MSTLRELTAESIGRITRRGLESQIALTDAALQPGEGVVAVAPGHDGPAAVLVTLTAGRLLLAKAEPFAKPSLDAHALADLTGAAAAAGADATWSLTIEGPDGAATVTGMFDRDAQRIAALIAA